MGAAYDAAGNMLGEMQANTMREVLDGLQQRHPDAAEIHIKSGEPPRDRMLQFFAHGHLPEHLAKVSLPFCQLAEEICATLPSNPERTVALRKLLEAKDCAVRALLYK